MSYKKSAEDILEAIGGEDNLDAMAHCATRLRLVLKDESIIDEKKLSEMDGTEPLKWELNKNTMF